MTAKMRGDGEPPEVDDVEGHDVVVAARDPGDRGIRHVQGRLVGREGEAVRVDEVVAHDRQLAGHPIEPEDEAAAQLRVGLVALVVVEDPVRRIGEPDRAVGRHDDVVRGVEPLALEPIHDRRPRPVRLVARHASRAVLAGEDPPVMIERVAVREIGRPDELRGAVGLRPAAHDVAPDVAPDDGIVVGQVDRALGPDRAVGEPGDHGVRRDERLESWVADDPFDRHTIHAPDASRSAPARPGRSPMPLGVQLDRADRDRPGLAGPLDAQLDAAGR